MVRKLLVNVYQWNEVRIWCEMFWSKTEDLCLQKLDVPFYQENLEPPKKKEKTLADFLAETKEGQWKPAPEDLNFRPFGPDWYVYDILEVGIEDVIDPGGDTWPDYTLDPWARWALRNGIAPFQPFLLSLPKPHYSGPDYWGEYDGPEYYHAVVDRIPLSNKQILKRWEDYLKSVELTIPEQS